MIVRRASVMGRCMGVKRAVDLALVAAAGEAGRGVFTLGPLIHNPQALAELEAKGVRQLSEAEVESGCAPDLTDPTKSLRFSRKKKKRILKAECSVFPFPASVCSGARHGRYPLKR